MLKERCMISQPMNGFTDEEIISTKERATKVIEELGYELVNSFFNIEFMNRDSLKSDGVIQIPVYFLSKSLERMSICHAVFFCKGWEEFRGCRIEHDVAKAYGLKIIYES